MKQFFYHMQGTIRTAVAFLLILSCMVTASAASVRAEEQIANQDVLGTEKTMAGTFGKANERANVQTNEQINEQIKEQIKEEIKKETETEDRKSVV